MSAPPPEIWPGFTVKAFEETVQYVLDTAVSLGLRDWEIAVSKIPDPEPDAFASVVCIYGQKRATVSLCREWPELDEQKRRRVIAHELTHCHLDAGFRYLEETLPELVGVAAKPILSAMHAANELATDAIADAFAPHLPPAP